MSITEFVARVSLAAEPNKILDDWAQQARVVDIPAYRIAVPKYFQPAAGRELLCGVVRVDENYYVLFVPARLNPAPGDFREIHMRPLDHGEYDRYFDPVARQVTVVLRINSAITKTEHDCLMVAFVDWFTKLTFSVSDWPGWRIVARSDTTELRFTFNEALISREAFTSIARQLIGGHVTGQRRPLWPWLRFCTSNRVAGRSWTTRYPRLEPSAN